MEISCSSDLIFRCSNHRERHSTSPKCINNFHSNILTVKIPESITAWGELLKKQSEPLHVFFVFGSLETGRRLLERALFYIMSYPLGAFKLSCRSITFTEPSSLPLFNIMLPWEEDLDKGLKTFLLRQACGPPSIFPNQQTRLCSMDRLCTAILKSKNLPFLLHWGKREFWRQAGSFQGYKARFVSRSRLKCFLLCAT